MILADTTVIIDYLRRPTARLVAIAQTQHAAICGVTVAEVYAGARSPADFARYDITLALFGSVPVPLNIRPRARPPYRRPGRQRRNRSFPRHPYCHPDHRPHPGTITTFRSSK